MFHSPEWERGRQQKVELLERVGDAEVARHPRARSTVQRNQRVLLDLARARRSHPQRDVFLCVSQLHIRTRSKCKEVRRYSLGTSKTENLRVRVLRVLR